MTKVKICGITNKEDAKKALEFGADFLGFIFFDDSPRKIDPSDAQAIIDSLPKNVQKVGLFLNQDHHSIVSTAKMCWIDYLQLHGDESPGDCKELRKDFKIIKSFKVKDESSIAGIDKYEDVDHYLFDTYVKGMPGGTGISFNWDILKGKKFKKPIFLAGGLTPENVSEAIKKVSPYAVDVASGVEKSPGVKNHKLLKEFIENAKKA
ncbi:MAG: phosphoribosylanthranilate isomerase [Candidatus Omnitrophica bacterium]|nr:phosphoribosylanthranilate isomerase [Candidatus Omnitrophota bacterium]